MKKYQEPPVKTRLKERDFDCSGTKMIKDGKVEPCKCDKLFKRQRNNLRMWMNNKEYTR